MALLDLIAELTGTLPGLSPFLARTYINRAWSDVRRKRLWSFLITDGVVNCPGIITAGSASITQYAATLTLDAAASAAIASQLGVNAVPGIHTLQIRFGSSTQLGGIYSIIDADATVPTAVVLTLDRVVQEATTATSAYQLYRCYVVSPIADFQSWISLEDFTNAIAIQGNRLTLTSAQLDLRDPQRTSQGLAYWLASWGSNRISNAVTGATVPQATQNDGAPVYELWPHPTQGQVFYARIQRTGGDLVQPSDVLPDGIEESLVLQRALYKYGYPYAQANVANFPGFKNANWPTLMLQAKATWDELLIDAKRLDNNRELTDVWNRGHGLRTGLPFGRTGDLGYPIDANYLQSHLVRF